MEAVKLQLDKSIYSKEAIVKCLYWYSQDNEIDIKDLDCVFDINVIPYNQKVDNKILEQKLRRDLLDFNLRAIVAKETSTLRELILAKAFSHGEFDEDPKGEVLDVIGIKRI